VEIALVHDLAELRIGDLPRTSSHYFPEGAKKEAEAAAMADVLAPVAERALPLYEEYQRGTTPEAKLVKACDKLQLMLKVAVYERRADCAPAARHLQHERQLVAARDELRLRLDDIRL